MPGSSPIFLLFNISQSWVKSANLSTSKHAIFFIIRFNFVCQH